MKNRLDKGFVILDYTEHENIKSEEDEVIDSEKEAQESPMNLKDQMDHYFPNYESRDYNVLLRQCKFFNEMLLKQKI